MFDVVLFALPVFGVLMAAEFGYGLYRGRNTYRLDDAIGSLTQGLLSQLFAVCTQLLQIGLYAACFEHVALRRADAFWNSWAGWLLAVLAYDLCDYWLHRLSHTKAVLWAAHVVHHQSDRFNFSTALRQESLLPVLGWMFYLPMAVIGIPPENYAIAGLAVLLYQFWIHTEHVGRLGWFDRVFSSPSNHRVHHAVNDRYLDKNFGGVLVVWDRLFGTFAEEHADEPCIYGTRSAMHGPQPLRALTHVYAELLGDAWQTERWADKWRVLWNAPDWRPADVAARSPRPPFDIGAPRDTVLPPPAAIAAVAVALFVAMVVASAALLWAAESLSTWQRAGAAAGIAVGLCLVNALLGAGGVDRSGQQVARPGVR